MGERVRKARSHHQHRPVKGLERKVLEMKQQNWKKSMTAIVMAGVLGVSVAAGAAAVRQKISAELRPDITLKVNGQVQELEKEAISYQGSTYLPVRAVGEAMGMEVDWDSKTQIVSLNGSWKDDDGADVQNGAIGMEKAKSIALKDVYKRQPFMCPRTDYTSGTTRDASAWRKASHWASLPWNSTVTGWSRSMEKRPMMDLALTI